MDLQQRAQDVAEELKKINSDTVYVVTLKRRDRYQQEGRVFLVRKHMAARLVVDGTHDYATPEQIQAYEAEHAKRSEEIKRQVAQAEQKFQLNLSPELIAAAVAAAQSAQQAPPAVKSRG